MVSKYKRWEMCPNLIIASSNNLVAIPITDIHPRYLDLFFIKLARTFVVSPFRNQCITSSGWVFHFKLHFTGSFLSWSTSFISPTILRICPQPGQHVSGKSQTNSIDWQLHNLHKKRICPVVTTMATIENEPYPAFSLNFSILIYERWHMWKVKVNPKSTGWHRSRRDDPQFSRQDTRNPCHLQFLASMDEPF